MVYSALKKSLKYFLRGVVGSGVSLRLAFCRSGQESGGKQAFERLCAAYPWTPVTITGEGSFAPDFDLQIIVPAYNEEKNIERCIEEICRQKSRFSVRLVVVNDGSGDGTGAKLDEIAERFRQGQLTGVDELNVIHKENGGLSSARNAGLNDIRARYIMFCDADDTLAPGAIDALMKTAIRENADIVEGTAEAVDADGKVLERFGNREGEILPMRLLGYVWGKVFKAEIFRNLRFPAGYLYEDSIAKYCVYPYVGKCYAIKDCVYHYYRNYGGISKSSVKTKRAVSTFYITAALWDDLRSKCARFDSTYRRQLLRQMAVNYRRTYLLGREINRDGFAFMREKYLEFADMGGYDGLPWLYALLDKAVVRNDFLSYRLLCMKWLYL